MFGQTGQEETGGSVRLGSARVRRGECVCALLCYQDQGGPGGTTSGGHARASNDAKKITRTVVAHDSRFDDKHGPFPRVVWCTTRWPVGRGNVTCTSEEGQTKTKPRQGRPSRKRLLPHLRCTKPHPRRSKPGSSRGSPPSCTQARLPERAARTKKPRRQAGSTHSSRMPHTPHYTPFSTGKDQTSRTLPTSGRPMVEGGSLPPTETPGLHDIVSTKHPGAIVKKKKKCARGGGRWWDTYI